MCRLAPYFQVEILGDFLNNQDYHFFAIFTLYRAKYTAKLDSASLCNFLMCRLFLPQEDTLSLTVSTVPVDGLGEGGIRLDVFLTVFTGQTWAATLAMAALISAACAAIFSKRRTDKKRNPMQWYIIAKKLILNNSI